MQVNQKFDGLDHDDIAKLNVRFTNNSFVLLISSKESDKFHLYWKSKFIQHLLKFKVYDGYDFFYDIKIFEFLAKFLILSLNNGHLGKEK